MRYLRLSCAAVAAILFCALALAQGDPKTILREISDLRAAKTKEARDSGKPFTRDVMNAINAEVKAKADAAIKDVDPAKIAARDALDWAQVFAIAGRNKEVCDLAGRFVASGPTAEQKFTAQMLMMQACNALGEADMLAATLSQVRAPNAATAAGLAGTAAMYAQTIAEKQGPDAAIKALSAVEAGMIYDDPQAMADRSFERQQQIIASNPSYRAQTKEQLLAAAKAQNESTKFMFAETKAELLSEAGRTADAVKVLDAFLASADPAGPIFRSAKMFKTRLTLKGSIAPPLAVERSYGGFTDLASLKGKVVIIDTFAHWCGPCIASFPDMRKLYDELKPKGLEVVGVTTYYGYYKSENVQKRDMDKDAEFARMADFMKEQNINWPVVYGDRSNFEKYGVTGIPTVFLIDRKGVVQAIHVGYSPETFKAFRAKVEELLSK